MKIEQLKNGLWVPSSDAQIEQWREKGHPHMQDTCLKQFVDWCEMKDKKFNLILDIGAWCGTWSMAMQKYANEMYCYEPNRTHFECLIKNLESYDNVKLFNHAVGNQDGKIKLTEESATQNTRVVLETGDTVICKIDSMDTAGADMLKIDVEGLEMEVLKGAGKILDGVECIMIELNNNSKKYGSSNSSIEKYLKELGFEILIKTWPDIVYIKS
jgi:FkbM family methyltransferase|tara:strand:- start:2317 stop:2958 length:642 start_codon:yes stop_codon:yes gene_type:complete